MLEVDLLAIQAPLREHYEARPNDAQLRLSARSTLNEGLSCSVATGRAIEEAGLHPSVGGDGSTLCSGDMLLEALAACAGVTLRSVAAVLKIKVRNATITAEGDIDVRGTLGMAEVPIGFSSIRLTYEIDSDAPDDQLDGLIAITERHCIVYQTLTGAANVQARWQRTNSPTAEAKR